jgi:hypothetical protein
MDCLHQESQSVSIDLGLLDQSSSQVVGASPLAEITNVLTVKRDGLSSDLVEFVPSQHNLGSVHSRREDSKLGHVSHLQARGTSAGRASGGHGDGAWSLRDDKGRASSGGNAETLDGRNQHGEENCESLEILHCVLMLCIDGIRDGFAIIWCIRSKETRHDDENWRNKRQPATSSSPTTTSSPFSVFPITTRVFRASAQHPHNNR